MKQTCLWLQPPAQNLINNVHKPPSSGKPDADADADAKFFGSFLFASIAA